MVSFGCSMSILVVEPLCTAKGGFCRSRIHTAVDGRQKLEYSRGEPGNAKKGISHARSQMVDRQLASPLNAQESINHEPSGQTYSLKSCLMSLPLETVWSASNPIACLKTPRPSLRPLVRFLNVPPKTPDY